MFNLALESVLVMLTWKVRNCFLGKKKRTGWIQETTEQILTLRGVTRFTEALKARQTRHREVNRQIDKNSL